MEVDEFDAVVHDYGVSVGQELLARKYESSGAAGLGRIAFLKAWRRPFRNAGDR